MLIIYSDAPFWYRSLGYSDSLKVTSQWLWSLNFYHKLPKQNNWSITILICFRLTVGFLFHTLKLLPGIERLISSTLQLITLEDYFFQSNEMTVHRTVDLRYRGVGFYKFQMLPNILYSLPITNLGNYLLHTCISEKWREQMG